MMTEYMQAESKKKKDSPQANVNTPHSELVLRRNPHYSAVDRLIQLHQF